MKDLLWIKEQEINELRKSYVDDLTSHPATLGYILGLGFNNIYLRMPDGERVEIGYLYINKDGFREYSGECSDAQLATYVELDEAYYDRDDSDGTYWTEVVVTCLNDGDYKKFKEIGGDR